MFSRTPWFSAIVPGQDVLVTAGCRAVPLRLSQEKPCPSVPRTFAQHAFPLLRQSGGPMPRSRDLLWK